MTTHSTSEELRRIETSCRVRLSAEFGYFDAWSVAIQMIEQIDTYCIRVTLRPNESYSHATTDSIRPNLIRHARDWGDIAVRLGHRLISDCTRNFHVSTHSSMSYRQRLTAVMDAMNPQPPMHQNLPEIPIFNFDGIYQAEVLYLIQTMMDKILELQFPHSRLNRQCEISGGSVWIFEPGYSQPIHGFPTAQALRSYVASIEPERRVTVPANSQGMTPVSHIRRVEL